MKTKVKIRHSLIEKIKTFFKRIAAIIDLFICPLVFLSANLFHLMRKKCIKRFIITQKMKARKKMKVNKQLMLIRKRIRKRKNARLQANKNDALLVLKLFNR